MVVVLRTSVSSLGFFLVSLVFSSCTGEPIADDIGSQTWETKRQGQMAARGERLVDIVGCDACHTPRILGPSGLQPDVSRRLSGSPESTLRASSEGTRWNNLIPDLGDNTVFITPFGAKYATNLTPDKETGIGTWSEELFVSRMTQSQHWVTYSQHISPFVWSGYYSLTEQDLRSIYAYLVTLPSVENFVLDSSVSGDWQY